MRDIEKFALPDVTNPTMLVTLDTGSATDDKLFAEAIMASEPTSILEEAGIIVIQRLPPEKDVAVFPIIRNTQLTWTTITPRQGAAGNAGGSAFDSTALNPVGFTTVRPLLRSANVFLDDSIELANKVNFETLAKFIAVDAKRYMESEGLKLIGNPANQDNVYAAGGFTAGGSTIAGSTLDPLDLIKAKRLLSTGSDPVVPDFVIMHPNTYDDINTHADFAPGATTNGAMLRKARFNDDGDIVRFDGMDIYVSELVPSLGSTSLGADITFDPATVISYPVIVGKKWQCLARAQHQGIRISTEDSRIRHGQWKVVDVSFGYGILRKEAMVNIVASGE